MTARVIADVAADILCVVEAEDRPSIDRFSAVSLSTEVPSARSIRAGGNSIVWARRFEECGPAPEQVGPQLRVLRARDLARLPVGD